MRWMCTAYSTSFWDTGGQTPTAGRQPLRPTGRQAYVVDSIRWCVRVHFGIRACRPRRAACHSQHCRRLPAGTALRWHSWCCMVLPVYRLLRGATWRASAAPCRSVTESRCGPRGSHEEYPGYSVGPPSTQSTPLACRPVADMEDVPTILCSAPFLHASIAMLQASSAHLTLGSVGRLRARLLPIGARRHSRARYECV